MLEPCCGEGALATVLAAESALKVVGSDLYPDRYAEAAALYATTAPVDARDPGALLKVIEMTGAAALVTNPPYGRDHHRIARFLFGLVTYSRDLFLPSPSTEGSGTISSTWWVWTAEPRPSALPGTVWVKRRPCASTRTGQATTTKRA